MIPTKNLALLSCCAFLLCLGHAAQADDYGYYSDNSLQAPNVSFFAAAQASSTNLHYLGGDREDGLNLLVGAYFNDVKFAGLRYGVELGYQNASESQQESTRPLTSTELSGKTGNPTSGELSTIGKLRFSSLSFGGRFEGDHFFFRFGGALYNYHTSSQDIVYYYYDPGTCTGCQTRTPTPTYSESKSSLAPYLGFGLHIPLIEHLRLTAGYDVYNVESHRVDSVTIGLMYTD